MTAGGAPGAESPVHPLVTELAAQLTAAHLSVAAAESCTGGLLATWITDLPGSSTFFRGGVVAYSNEVKQELLGVPAPVIEATGAVSSDVAQAMAEGVRVRLGADLGVATTGIAGPAGGGPDKPVGLTYLWAAGARGGSGRRFVFDGDRWSNRRQATEAALQLLLDEMAALRAPEEEGP